NSIEGGVSATLDLLIHETDLRIFRELVVPIRHMLVAREDLPLGSIRKVISHPQALGQCRRFLDRYLPNAEQVASLSTAGAVQAVVEGDDPFAVAIGPGPAQELYGGVVLSDSIQDNPTNLTRFIAVRNEDEAPTGDDKTSIGITADADEPGVLEKIIRPIADAGLNLTRLESRPTKGWLGTYVFLIDFEGHRSERRVQDVLAEIKRFSTTLKVFGSYPRFPVEHLKEMVQAPAEV
ncbi:MAG TPA: prephenate dehydratase domain-containing protein, partial [Thermomicrobiales bacterium]|nr:prephenate dehydratase domain-containing protein [Thermomicrobiales bacterium]